MKTFTMGYPGTLIREYREHPHSGLLRFYSYLSADLRSNGWISVEKWDFSEATAVTEAELRTVLEAKIEAKKKEVIDNLSRLVGFDVTDDAARP